MKNASELIAILENKIAEGMILNEQIKGELIVQETNAQMAVLISIPIGVVVNFVLFYSGYYPSNFDRKLTSVVIWLICFTITYWIMKARSKSNQ